MDIFGILSMVGGLALFLFGMNAMGDGLAKLSGGKLERILEKLTSKRIMAVILGAAVTAVIQSSSATTVMVVGFVNSGIMQLGQAVGIIMGANIGTTITSWLLSLTSIDGGSIAVQLLKPSSFSPILAIIGIIMIMRAKDDNRKKDIGNILVGFAILMFGMETMSDAVKPLADVPEFTSILTKFSNPILGMLAGALLTAVIQSSSASVGILQALCATGAVGYGAAIPIIMGQNIGTCVTALMSSVGANKNAKRASMIHLYFNLIGTILFMVVFYAINAIHPFAFLDDSASKAGIAVIHSLFNIGCAIVLFPFGNLLVKLATITIPDYKHPDDNEDTVPAPFTILDERFLEKPAFAMELARNEAIKMAQMARDAMYLALDNLNNYSVEKVEQIEKLETDIDHYQDALGSYLVKLGNHDLSKNDSRNLSIMIYCISDFERISDHALILANLSKQMVENDLSFSNKANAELEVICDALRDILSRTTEVFDRDDIVAAKEVEPLEQVIDVLNLEIKQRHMRRLRKGKCTMELGLILQDMLTHIARVSDHCSNIAVTLIQVHEDGYETHEYNDQAKEEADPWFQQEFHLFSDKYVLPGKNGIDTSALEDVLDRVEKQDKQITKSKKKKNG